MIALRRRGECRSGATAAAREHVRCSCSARTFLATSPARHDHPEPDPVSHDLSSSTAPMRLPGQYRTPAAFACALLASCGARARRAAFRAGWARQSPQITHRRCNGSAGSYVTASALLPVVHLYNLASSSSAEQGAVGSRASSSFDDPNQNKPPHSRNPASKTER